MTLDEALRDLAQKIAEMSLSVDGDEAIPTGDKQWRKGYKQACSDIILMVCQAGQKHAYGEQER